MASSSKHIVQIVELLNERGLSFSMCLNKDELLVLSGLGLLYQSLDLDPASKLFKDNQKMVTAVSTLLIRSHAPCAAEFGRVACSLIPIDSTHLKVKHPAALSRHNSDGAMSAPQFFNLSPPEKNKLKAAAQRLMIKSPFESKDQRRATFPNISIHQQAPQTQSVPNLGMPLSPVMVHQPRSEPARSPPKLHVQPANTHSSVPPSKNPAPVMRRKLNLDYLSFSNGPTRVPSPDHTDSSDVTRAIKHELTDWEKLLGSIDNGQTNIFDNIYGGPPVEFLKDTSRIATTASVARSHASETLVWDSPDVWALHGADVSTHASCNMGTGVHQSESVFSLGTDEGTASGEEVFGHDWNSASSSNGSDAYAGIVMPDLGGSDDGLLHGVWDSTTAVI